MQSFGNWKGGSGSNTPYKQEDVKFDASQYEFFGKNVMEHELGESYDGVDETDPSDEDNSVHGNAKGKYVVSSSSADDLATTFSQLNMINEPRKPSSIIQKPCFAKPLGSIRNPKTVPHGRRFGTVKWYSNERGYGFLTSTNSEDDIFVHSSSLKTDGCIHLSAGTSVEFEVVFGWDRKLQAINVTAPGGKLLKDSRRIGHGGDATTKVSTGGGGSGGGGGSSISGTSHDVGPCFSCGQWGHLAKNCNHLVAKDGPWWSITKPTHTVCYNCGNIGHLVYQCPYGRIHT